MIIKSLKLTNFRNHSFYELTCNNETSLILGPNGYGKTTVLEAIYILLRGKSFRATDPDILKRGQDFYRIELLYQSGESIVATYDGKTKTFLTTGKKSHRLPKKSRYPVVLFEPADLNLIKNSPSSRRSYFDRIFSQFDSSYATNLSRYEKALKQRNELLKTDTITKEMLFSWNVLLAKHGLAIYSARTKFVAEINAQLTSVYRSIAENNDTVQINYVSELLQANPKSLEQQYLVILEQNFDRDRLLGHTTFGVHRDDFIFQFNGKPADTSASRGESRTIILALKFIEAELIYQKTALRPLILLDDVFSELDDTRRHALITNFKNHQIILTSVEDINLNE